MHDRRVTKYRVIPASSSVNLRGKPGLPTKLTRCHVETNTTDTRCGTRSGGDLPPQPRGLPTRIRKRQRRSLQLSQYGTSRGLKLTRQLTLETTATRRPQASLKAAGISSAVHAHTDAGARHQIVVSVDMTRIWMTGLVPSA